MDRRSFLRAGLGIPVLATISRLSAGVLSQEAGVGPYGPLLGPDANVLLLPFGFRFQHEAAAVHPVGRRVYLTEDRIDGCLYRFTPAEYPSLTDGVLEAAAVRSDNRVRWLRVRDPSASSLPTRLQAPDATAFERGEGAWFDRGTLWFATTGDGRLWALDTTTDRLRVAYDREASEEPVLSGLDNVTVARSGDLYVAEDGGNMELVLVTRERAVVPFCRFVGHDGSEVTGPAFDPSGTRLYLSSQRGGPDEAGMTFEISGSFRRTARADPQPRSEDDGQGPWPAIGGGLAGAAAAAAGLLHLRRHAVRS